MRKRIFIIGVREDIVIEDLNKIFDLKDYEKKITLSNFLNKNFKKDIAYTIRCGGRKSPINDKHNWDGYIVDDKEYRLTIEDALKLQGFTDTEFKLTGNEKEKWTLLGNTIPTIFTEILGKQLKKLFFETNV
jgi:DNA (cytosine-5)-methyltransferase 1